MHDLIVVGGTVEGAAAAVRATEAGLSVAWIDSLEDGRSLWGYGVVDVPWDALGGKVSGIELHRILSQRLGEAWAQVTTMSYRWDEAARCFVTADDGWGSVCGRHVIVTNPGMHVALPAWAYELLGVAVTTAPADLDYSPGPEPRHVLLWGTPADCANAACFAAQHQLTTETLIDRGDDGVVGIRRADKGFTALVRRDGVTSESRCGLVLICREYVPHVLRLEGGNPHPERVRQCGYLAGVDYYATGELWRDGWRAAGEVIEAIGAGTLG